jgi:hypothetical protein
MVHNEMDGKGMSNDYAAAVVRASRGADPVTTLRGKTKQMENIQEALQTHLTSQWTRALAGDSAAETEALQTAAQIKQLVDNKSYAGIENQQVVNTLDTGTIGIRGASVPPGVVPPPGTIASIVHGEIIDPATKAVIAPAAARRDDWLRFSPQPRNMNDPNLP